MDQRNAKVFGCIKMFRRRHNRIDTGGGCKLSPFGTYANLNECLSDPDTSCGSFVCDDDGSPRPAENNEAGVSWGDLLCWKCNGNPGPDSTCGTVTDGTTGGQYASKELCERNDEAMCGWGYKQDEEGGECKVSNDADVRGTSFDTCFVGTNPNTWKYGCFDKFARRGGKCVGIPSTGDDGPRNSESVYPSLEVCETPGRASQWTPASITVDSTRFTKDGEGKREHEEFGRRIYGENNLIPNTARDMITCLTQCNNNSACLALNFYHTTTPPRCDLSKVTTATGTTHTNLSAYLKK